MFILLGFFLTFDAICCVKTSCVWIAGFSWALCVWESWCYHVQQTCVSQVATVGTFFQKPFSLNGTAGQEWCYTKVIDQDRCYDFSYKREQKSLATQPHWTKTGPWWSFGFLFLSHTRWEPPFNFKETTSGANDTKEFIKNLETSIESPAHCLFSSLRARRARKQYLSKNPGPPRDSIFWAFLSGSHRSTHMANDFASWALASQAKPQRESESQAFRIARS